MDLCWPRGNKNKLVRVVAAAVLDYCVSVLILLLLVRLLADLLFVSKRYWFSSSSFSVVPIYTCPSGDACNVVSSCILFYFFHHCVRRPEKKRNGRHSAETWKSHFHFSISHPFFSFMWRTLSVAVLPLLERAISKLRHVQYELPLSRYSCRRLCFSPPFGSLELMPSCSSRASGEEKSVSVEDFRPSFSPPSRRV